MADFDLTSDDAQPLGLNDRTPALAQAIEGEGPWPLGVSEDAAVAELHDVESPIALGLVDTATVVETLAVPAVEPGGRAHSWPLSAPSLYGRPVEPEPEPEPALVVLLTIRATAPRPEAHLQMDVEDLAALWRADDDWLLTEAA